MTEISAEKAGGTNVTAFLDTLAMGGEGTDVPTQPTKDRGYDVLVGGGNFTSYRDHPRKVIAVKHRGMTMHSSAAGRYQFIRATWDALARKLGLKDFSPINQDRAAIELLRECGALALLKKGQFDEACHAARKIWASLPGAGYGQREESLDALRKIFVQQGGVICRGGVKPQNTP